MRSPTLNQDMYVNDIVNKRNKWLFSTVEVSRYLVKRNDSLLIPPGKTWRSFLTAYPSYVYTLLKLAYFLVRQLFSDKTSFDKKPTHILVSTGAGYDLKNYSKYFLDSNVEVIHLEAFNTSQKINFNIVKIKSVCSFFLENLRETNRILKLKLPVNLRKRIIHYSLPQLATYTYLCAFLSAIKEQIPNVKIFHSGAIILSDAATRAGIETICLYHGLARKQSKADFPFFDHIYVYAIEEKTYLEDISPNANVCLYPVKELSKLEKKIIIFLSQLDIHMSEKNLAELIALFKKNDYEIFLKKHPTYTGSLVDKIASKYSLEMIDLEKDASEAILSLRPSFTIGWGSTALCESLRQGVVPISLVGSRTGQSSNSQFHEEFLKSKEKKLDVRMGVSYASDYLGLEFSWLVYPFKKRTLSWKEEKERIFELLEDTSLYTKTLSELRKR